jgi:hypothetical protein
MMKRNKNIDLPVIESVSCILRKKSNCGQSLGGGGI